METFEDIYSEYFSRVYGFLYKLCSDDSLAEELTQETFYQAFCSFRRFRGDSELFTWLASIAKYTFFNYLRKSKRTQCVNIDLLEDTLESDDESDPEVSAQKEETAEAIRRAVMKIPEKYRDVVLLRLYAGLPFSEIAESLGITENSAKVLFYRAKKMLSEEIKHDYFV